MADDGGIVALHGARSCACGRTAPRSACRSTRSAATGWSPAARTTRAWRRTGCGSRTGSPGTGGSACRSSRVARSRTPTSPRTGMPAASRNPARARGRARPAAAVPPPAPPALRCVVPGGPYASPTWSPDGTMLAWEQADGVHVAGPVPDLRPPVPDCSVIAQRRLTAGTDPYWGRADVPGATSGRPPPGKPVARKPPRAFRSLRVARHQHGKAGAPTAADLPPAGPRDRARAREGPPPPLAGRCSSGLLDARVR